MNRKKWTYISHKGEKSIITILHSPRLGHFLVLFNKKILLADKKVFNPDSYTFFIDDELCTIDIVKTNSRWEYNFSFDTTAETELNQIRKEKRKKNLLYSLATFSGLFTVVTILMIVSFIVQDNSKWKSLRDNGVLSTATIEIVEKDGRHHVFYYYRDSIRGIRGITESYKEPNPILENGFPLETNDQFLVTYSSKVKVNNKLHLNQPTTRTIQRYQALTKERYLVNNPKISIEYCDCIMNVAYEIKQWQGFALLYNERTDSDKHKLFNQKTYQQWINSKAFLDKEEFCWQYK